MATFAPSQMSLRHIAPRVGLQFQSGPSSVASLDSHTTFLNALIERLEDVGSRQGDVASNDGIETLEDSDLFEAKLAEAQLRALVDLASEGCVTLQEYAEEWESLLHRPLAGLRLLVELGPFEWLEDGMGVRVAVQRCQGHVEALRRLLREKIVSVGRIQMQLNCMKLAYVEGELAAWTADSVRIAREHLRDHHSPLLPEVEPEEEQGQEDGGGNVDRVDGAKVATPELAGAEADAAEAAPEGSAASAAGIGNSGGDGGGGSGGRRSSLGVQDAGPFSSGDGLESNEEESGPLVSAFDGPAAAAAGGEGGDGRAKELLRTAREVVAAVARGGSDLEAQLGEHAPVSRARRHWLFLSIATPVIGVTLLLAWKDRRRIVLALQSVKGSLAAFLREHITEPAQAIYTELFNNKRASITDMPAIEDTRRSLQRMLVDFVAEKYPDLPAAERERIFREMDMSVVSLEYEKSIINAVRHVMSGDILRMLLIQVQFLKKELLNAMSAMETLMDENEFNLRMMATLPAVLLGYLAYQAGTPMYYFVTREKSRKATFSAMRMIVLAMERLLNLRNSASGLRPHDMTALTRTEVEALTRGTSIVLGDGGGNGGGGGSKDRRAAVGVGLTGAGPGPGSGAAAGGAAASATPPRRAWASGSPPGAMQGIDGEKGGGRNGGGPGEPTEEEMISTLDELDLGRFVLLVWQLRRIVWQHPRRFGRADLDNLSEDLAELMGDRGPISVPQQLCIVQRMQRCYKFLQIRSTSGLLPLG